MASETVQYCDPPSFDSNANITFGDDFPFPIPFLFNVSENHSHPLLDNFTTDTVPGEKLYRDIMYYCYDIILPIIFVFGVIGNVLNIIIFSKSRFRHSFDEVEKSATAGLMALAVSDLLFCFIGVPGIFLKTNHDNGSSYFNIVAFMYQKYKIGLFNVFLFSSTWLTVAISIERYLAVCYPLHVRWLVRVKRTIMIDVSIYIVSILFNLPEFLKHKFLFVNCPDEKYQVLGLLATFYYEHNFKHAYRVTWAVLGAFIPVIILTFCNIRLIVEVSRSKARYSADRGKHTASRITIILITIIVLHVLLVFPSLFLAFLIDFYANRVNKVGFLRFTTALVITNVMQTINFAINFIMYCVISKTFRENLKGRTCNLARIHSTLKTNTPRTSSEETKHRYKLVDMPTNDQTMSTRATPPSSKGNGNCLR